MHGGQLIFSSLFTILRLSETNGFEALTLSWLIFLEQSNSEVVYNLNFKVHIIQVSHIRNLQVQSESNS